MCTCGNDIGPGIWKCDRTRGHPGPCMPAESQPVESRTPRADFIRRQIHDVLSGPLAYTLGLDEARDLDQVLRIELGFALEATGDISIERAAQLNTRLVLIRAVGHSLRMPAVELPSVEVGH